MTLFSEIFSDVNLSELQMWCLCYFEIGAFLILSHVMSGSYCNHYFLRLLASISRGLYGAAHDPG